MTKKQHYMTRDERYQLEALHRARIPISQIARQCSLSTLTIQKVITILSNSGSDKLTVPDLASRMSTTVRNANRIMLNLCKGGAAAPVYTQITHSRGRPVQVYQLNINIPHIKNV